MSAQQRVGWVAGVAVSAGIGAAVLLGGTGTATADAPSSASDTGDPSSGAAERGDTDQDAVTASAESVDADQDPSDDEDPRDDVAGQTVSSASSGEETDEIADADEEAAAAEETESEGTDSGDPAPAQTQAVAALMSSARRGSSEPGEAAAEVPNSAPSVTTSVGVPDPLSGVTNIAVTGLDPDGDQLRYTAARPTFGRVTGDGTGAFTYTPTSFSRLLARFVPFVRSDRFAVTVSDGRGGVTSSTVNLTIVPLNSAPRARATTVNTPVQATGVVTGKANATDPNWDRLTFVASTVDTARGRVTVNGNGTFIYTPTAAARHSAAATAASTADRTDTFRVAVADAYGAVTEIPVTVTISPANVAPTATAGVQNPD
ncbi:MAG: Ig-like domain-containing protein, partial [Mycolicibacterium vanbaalenii]